MSSHGSPLRNVEYAVAGKRGVVDVTFFAPPDSPLDETASTAIRTLKLLPPPKAEVTVPFKVTGRGTIDFTGGTTLASEGDTTGTFFKDGTFTTSAAVADVAGPCGSEVEVPTGAEVDLTNANGDVLHYTTFGTTCLNAPMIRSGACRPRVSSLGQKGVWAKTAPNRRPAALVEGLRGRRVGPGNTEHR